MQKKDVSYPLGIYSVKEIKYNSFYGKLFRNETRNVEVELIMENYLENLEFDNNVFPRP